MHNLKIHHIGYLVKKIESAMTQFKQLGFVLLKDIVYDDIRKVNICFMDKNGYTIELVSPVSEESVVSNLLKKYKNCPYHICYETNDMEQSLFELTSNGFTAIDTPTPAPALEDRKVVFLLSPVIGMIELLEVKHS